MQTMMIALFVCMTFLHSAMCQIFPAVTLDNTVLLSTPVTYQFVINRPMMGSIPAGSRVQVGFPSNYDSTVSNYQCFWGATQTDITSNCVFSSRTLTISNQFTAGATPFSISFGITGIKNPAPAATYPLTYKIMNGATQIEKQTVSVTITMGQAYSCSIDLSHCTVFQSCNFTMAYVSSIIDSLSEDQSYYLELRMSESYPEDATNTDIETQIAGSTSVGLNYQLQVPYQNAISIKMLMPPSTESVSQFIYVKSFSDSGNYDYCYLDIEVSIPNSFTAVALSPMRVQEAGDLTITFTPNTPIVFGDQIEIDFTDTTFQIDEITAVNFSKGALDTKPYDVNGKVLTISQIMTDGSPPIQGEVILTLKNIIAPVSDLPQSIQITSINPPSYKRDQSIELFTAQTGSLTSSSFQCSSYEIGTTTNCIISIKISHSLPETGILQINFPQIFAIPSSTLACSSNSGSPVCTGTSNNQIDVSTLSNTKIAGGTVLNISVQLTLPTSPSTMNLQYKTLTEDGSVIDTGSASVTTVSRKLINDDQVSISFNTQFTNTENTLTVNLELPSIFTFDQNFFDFNANLGLNLKGNSIQVTPNGLTISYTFPNIVVASAVGSSSVLTFNGFFTPDSTKPIYITGSLTKDGLEYFYFNQIQIAMTSPSQFAVLKIIQSNYVVGESSVASLNISGLVSNDYIKFPQEWYSDVQSDCSINCECRADGKVIIQEDTSESENYHQIKVNIQNPEYFSSHEIVINSFDEAGYPKQTGTITIKATILNQIIATKSEAEFYFAQVSTYRINLTLSGTVTASVPRFVDIAVPVLDGYVVNPTSTICALGCTTTDTDFIDGNITLVATSTIIRVSLSLTNPQPTETNIFYFQIQSRISEGLVDQVSENSLSFSPRCQLPCRSCTTVVTECLTCYDTEWLPQNKYRSDSKTCVAQCQDDEYCQDSAGMPTCQCTACPLECAACTSGITCQQCVEGYYLFEESCGSECPETFYEDSETNECLTCSDACLNCNSSEVCVLCSETHYLYNGECSENCLPKTFPSVTSTSKICIDCPSECSTCTSLTTCTACEQGFTLSSKTCIAACPSGQFISIEVVNGITTNVCAPCQTPCATCEDTSQTCLTCANGYILYPFNSTCVRSCPASYFYSSQQNQCQLCHSSCSDCSDSSVSSCLSCSNPTKYLQIGTCVDECQVLYPNNDLLICQACRSPCLECTESTICTSCVDGYSFLNDACYRNCPSTYYSDSAYCLKCSDNSNCSTCRMEQSIICTSCQSTYVFFGEICISSGDCVSPNRISSSYCLSSSCESVSNCLACSDLVCLECATNFTLTSSNQCVPIEESEKTLSTVSELPVPFPFVIATIAIIVIAFLIRMQFPKMFAPLFIYSFMGIAEACLFGLWIALIHLRTIDDSRLGTYLKLAAIVICFIYCAINILAFFFYLCIIRKDRKYRVWEKQDNLCASLAITFVALLISFRFGVLKYSKLAHSQKFSATVASDSKISHYNLFAYVSIGIISVPAIVVSAWISYLQTTMNYLFFTSMEVTVFCIIMIIVSILQSLTPKGYVVENKAQYKHGQDQQNLEGESLDEVMMGIDVVQEEYHEGKEIDSIEDEVGQGNRDSNENQDEETARYANFGTNTALAFKNRNRDNDERMQFEDIVNPPIDERKELENILIEAQNLAKKLEQPSRPFGIIKRQNRPQLESSFDSSEGIQSSMEEIEFLEFPPVNNQKVKEKKKNSSPIKIQQLMPINTITEQIELGERKLGMNKLKRLFEQLEMKEAEQKALSKRLEQVTQQQKNLKLKQYEKTRETIERSQMALEDKMGRIQTLFSGHKAKQQKRKQKIKEMEEQRKKRREEREKFIKIDHLVYPPPEEIEVQLIHVKRKNSDERESAQKREEKWNEQQKMLNFDSNNEWKITEEVQNQNDKDDNELQMDSPQRLDPIGDSHWPIDPELEAKIAEVEERAEKYIKRQNIEVDVVEDYGDMELISSSGIEGEDLVYQDDEEQVEEEHKQIEMPTTLEVEQKGRIPKFRVNRDVINLSPE